MPIQPTILVVDIMAEEVDLEVPLEQLVLEKVKLPNVPAELLEVKAKARPDRQEERVKERQLLLLQLLLPKRDTKHLLLLLEKVKDIHNLHRLERDTRHLLLLAKVKDIHNLHRLERDTKHLLLLLEKVKDTKHPLLEKAKDIHNLHLLERDTKHLLLLLARAKDIHNPIEKEKDMHNPLLLQERYFLALPHMLLERKDMNVLRRRQRAKANLLLLLINNPSWVRERALLPPEAKDTNNPNNPRSGKPSHTLSLSLLHSEHKKKNKK